MKSKILGLLAVGLLAAPMAANAGPLTIGDSVDVQNFYNGVLQTTFSGTIAVGADVSLFGYRLYLNEGANELDWWIESSSNFCGWYCIGGDVDFVVTGLDFGGSFDIVGFFSDFATGTFAILSDSSFSFSWTNDGAGTETFSGQRFIGGTFVTASVPEPGTLALLGLGLVGIGLRRRVAKAS